MSATLSHNSTARRVVDLVHELAHVCAELGVPPPALVFETRRDRLVFEEAVRPAGREWVQVPPTEGDTMIAGVPVWDRED